MKQILQSYKSGELWLAEVPAPLCKNRGVLVRTCASFVSAGTERMLVDFARKSLVGKALQMPDQVRKVIRKMQTEGVLSTLEKVQSKLDQPIPLGYSAAGVVVEAGTQSGEFAVGDRVCVATRRRSPAVERRRRNSRVSSASGTAQRASRSLTRRMRLLRLQTGTTATGKNSGSTTSTILTASARRA